MPGRFAACVAAMCPSAPRDEALNGHRAARHAAICPSHNACAASGTARGDRSARAGRLVAAAGSGAAGGDLIRAGAAGEEDQVLMELEPGAVVAVDTR